MFESGSGSYSTVWLLIQQKLAEQTRVCGYDRVGFGWSDEWPALKGKSSLHLTPRTIDQNVESLNQLLIQSEISGSLILVGHSYGGPMSLAFEAQHPNQVSGILLIDPHDDGDAREDRDESDVISESLKELEKNKSPEGQRNWAMKLKKITQDLANSETEEQILVNDLTALMDSLDPLKSLRAVFSEWAHFHSDCAKVKAGPSETLSHKLLTVISSDPTLEKSESQTYFHLKIAQQSMLGRFILASGAGHDIPSKYPDLVVSAIEQMLATLAEEKSEQLPEKMKARPAEKLPKHLPVETLPQLAKPTRFFVDGKLAEYVRANTQNSGDHAILRSFCRQLGFGFKTYTDLGYFHDQKTGIQGYFVICN